MDTPLAGDASAPRRRAGRRALIVLGGLTLSLLLTAAPALAAPTPAPSPGVSVTNGAGGLSQPVSLILLLGSLSVVPGLLIMITAFTRIVIVLGFTRSALGTQAVPPNQVIIGLALFLTLFVMGPQFSKANHDAVQPFLKGKITQSQAFDKGIEPFRRTRSSSACRSS